MANKHKSIFKVVLDSVSKISWLKGIRPPAHKHMKPGKDFNQPISNSSSDYLKELSNDEFKKLIVMIFKQRGYTTSTEEEQAYEDVELVLKMNNETTFVKFNRWKDELLDINEVAQLYVAMKEENAAHGIIITSGMFTAEALDLSLGKAMLLINGIDLAQMIDALKSSTNTENEGTMETEVVKEPAQDEMPELEPLCPICSCKMIKRTAKKGKNAGNTFWGCSKFPNCRGVVSD